MSFDSLAYDDFVFSPDSMLHPPESTLRYRPGGLHPVLLGDVICSANTRYHIVQKLGWGGSATVWLAQNLASLEWYSLRIRAAGCADEGEDEVIEQLVSKAHSPHLPVIAETFSITGPNGTHTVTVSDVISPLDTTLRQLPPGSVDLKAIVRGLVEGVTHMHNAGIVHGDLHIRNVGLEMPSLKDEDYGGGDPYRPACSCMPDVIVVLAKSPNAHVLCARGHFPRYQVAPVDLASHYVQLSSKLPSHKHLVKIFDFGNARLTRSSHATNGFIDDVLPPEWAIRCEASESDIDVMLDTSSDIWALGLMIFRIMSRGATLIRDGSDFRETLKLVGTIPRAWKTSYPGVDFPAASEVTPEISQRLWQKHWVSVRRTCVSDEDASALVALLQRIVILDPTSRPSAADILRDPWFSIHERREQPNDMGGMLPQSPRVQPLFHARPSYQPPFAPSYTQLHGLQPSLVHSGPQSDPVHPLYHHPTLFYTSSPPVAPSSFPQPGPSAPCLPVYVHPTHLSP
ncbi:unnamed protein product [Peniophora sp. CBMAI 1063]|nr:unnamed protein product [Peniophora sp. CBMAI 1063]